MHLRSEAFNKLLALCRRGIIFSAKSSRDIIEHRKTVTRRVVLPPAWLIQNQLGASSWNPGSINYICQAREQGWIAWSIFAEHGTQEEHAAFTVENYQRGFPCHIGDVGDLLYIREPWNMVGIDVGVRYPDPPRPGVFEEAYYGSVIRGHLESSDYEQNFICYQADDGAVDVGPMTLHLDNLKRELYRPAMHMPRKLSRSIIRIAAIRPERTTDLTEAEAQLEGYAGVSEYRAAFDALNGHRGKFFDSGVWVWRIEFELVAEAGG